VALIASCPFFCPSINSPARVPLSEVGRVLGHTQANTTFRYVNMNLETARRAAAALDQLHAEREDQEETVMSAQVH